MLHVKLVLWFRINAECRRVWGMKLVRMLLALSLRIIFSFFTLNVKSVKNHLN